MDPRQRAGVADCVRAHVEGRSGASRSHQGGTPGRIRRAHGPTGAGRGFSLPIARPRALRRCGGAMCVMSRAQGRGARVFVYGCMAHHKRGRTVCSNSTVVRMDRVDREVLGKLGGEVLRPAIVDAVLEGLFAALSDDGPARHAAGGSGASSRRRTERRPGSRRPSPQAAPRRAPDGSPRASGAAGRPRGASRGHLGCTRGDAGSASRGTARPPEA